MSRISGDPRELVHSPADLAGAYVDWAQNIRDGSGIKWGIANIDKRVIPMRPGDLVTLLARPGHGKTSLMAYFAKKEAERLRDIGNPDNECVIYTTWEQSAEEIEAFFATIGGNSVTDIAWGRGDIDGVKRHASKRAGFPLWVIGHGIGRAGKNTPRMTPEVVLGAIETMEADYGVKPCLMLFDYMQLVPVANFRDKVQRVDAVPPLIKELALRIGAPAMVGVQAARDVDTMKVKLPEMRHAQWASSIEQTSDKVFSLWRPYQTEGPDMPFEWADGSLVNATKDLLVLRMLKQRFAPGRFDWLLRFSPEYLQLNELELRYEEMRL